MTQAQDKAAEDAFSAITIAIAKLPVELALGALSAAVVQHPNITPALLETTGNLLCHTAWDMERNL